MGIRDRPLNCLESIQGTADRQWTIQNVQIKADTLICESTFTEQYSKILLEGDPLPIPITSYSQQMQAVNPAFDSYSININRAFTRLRAVLFTFWGPAGNVTAGGDYPTIVAVNQKRMNHFHHPQYNSDDYNTYDTLEAQRQIGSKVWPQYPVRGLNEFYDRLRQVLNTLKTGVISMYSPGTYHSTEFIAGMDLEKAVNGTGDGAAFSGVSTRGGEQLTLMLNKIPDIGGTARRPTEIYLTMAYDAILNIRAEGCEVLM